MECSPANIYRPLDDTVAQIVCIFDITMHPWSFAVGFWWHGTWDAHWILEPNVLEPECLRIMRPLAHDDASLLHDNEDCSSLDHSLARQLRTSWNNLGIPSRTTKSICHLSAFTLPYHMSIFRLDTINFGTIPLTTVAYIPWLEKNIHSLARPFVTS